MAQYILFDKLCEVHYISSFVNPALELMDKFKISYKNADFKRDLGLKTKAINELKFHTNNAFNISLAAKSDSEILCVDDSSFLSLSITLEALKNDDKLKADVTALLEDGLNLETKIVHLKTLLADIDFKTQITKPFDAFYTAIYAGSNANRLSKFLPAGSTCKIIDALGTKIVSIATSKESDGYEIVSVNQKYAYKLAGTILLDAFDNAADFLVSNDITAYCMLEYSQKEIAKIMGRDVNLSIYNVYQLLLLALGETSPQKLGLDAFQVKVTLL